MRLVPLDRAEGRALGRTIVSATGQVLLRRGVVLTPGYLQALRGLGYGAVYVEDPLVPDVELEEAVSVETQSRAQRAVREAFAQVQRAGDAAQARLGSLRVAADAVDAIVGELKSSGAVVTLVALRGATEYTFVHSVNVCVLCVLMGMQLGYDAVSLRQLGLGALLHDIGKVFCADLAEKPGKLTDEDWVRMKRHPWDGFEMLRSHPEVHLYSAHIALQHHERLDGSGYPRGLTGDRILPFARIAAVADVYDAVTADRPYRAGRPPHEAMGILQAEAGTKFDADVVYRLARRLAVYPNGSVVRLNTGELAVVLAQGLSPDLPRVRVVADRQLHPVAPQELDLDGDRRRIATLLMDWPAAYLARLPHPR